MPLRMYGELPMLVLTGTPGEIGFEHGHTMRTKIQKASEDFLKASRENFETDYELIERAAVDFLPFIPTDYVEEMRAIAEGADVSFEIILFTNTLIDIDTCVHNTALHCCNFVLNAPATAGELFVHGRNLDFGGARIIPEYSMIVVRSPEGKIPTCGISWVAFAGFLTGLSAEGMSVGEVGTRTTDAQMSGLPIPLLLRSAIEENRTLNDVECYVSRTPRVAGYNIALGSGREKASMALETTKSNYERRNGRHGQLIVDDVCLGRENRKKRLCHPNAAFRYARLVELVRRHNGEICKSKAREILCDHYDIARGRDTIRSAACICNQETVQSALMYPIESRVEVAASQSAAPLGGYHEIDLNQYW